MVPGDSQVFHQILGGRSLWHFDPFLTPDILWDPVFQVAEQEDAQPNRAFHQVFSSFIGQDLQPLQFLDPENIWTPQLRIEHLVMELAGPLERP
jgi:hypothetical protein